MTPDDEARFRYYYFAGAALRERYVTGPRTARAHGALLGWARRFMRALGQRPEHRLLHRARPSALRRALGRAILPSFAGVRRAAGQFADARATPGARYAARLVATAMLLLVAEGVGALCEVDPLSVDDLVGAYHALNAP